MPRGQQTKPLGRADRHAPLLGPMERLAFGAGAALVILLACWHIALWATTSGLKPADVTTTLTALLSGHPTRLGHGISNPNTPLTAAVFIALAGVVSFTATVLIIWGVNRRTRRAGKGLASAADIKRQAGENRARQQGTYVRPSLGIDGRPPTAAQLRAAPLREFGFVVGRAQPSGQPAVVSHEDSMGALAPTGSGKTRNVVIPASLEAVGPLVLTATRADALDVIYTPMSQRGTVWVFDPLNSCGWPEKMVWNPVTGCENGQTAMARAEAFVAGVGADNDAGTSNSQFFKDAAVTAIQSLTHAAALGGGDMRDVLRWAINLANADEPRAILRRPEAEPDWDTLLISVATGAHETVSSTRTTLTNKLRPLLLRQVLTSIVPQPNVRQFYPDQFVRSNDTLILLCDNNAPANVAPLTTMLFDEVLEAAKRAGRISPAGRLDPPLRAVCDEIANVAPLPKFPALTSDTRALGIQLIWALQSWSQAEDRWGRLGAQTLWDNTVARLVLGGIADPDTLDRLSRVVGEVNVTDTSLQFSSGGGRGFIGSGPGYSESRQEKRKLRPDEIRELGDNTGLALFGRAPAMVLSVPPWTSRPDAAALSAGERATRARRTDQGAA